MKSAVVFVWLLLIFLLTSWYFLTPGMFYLHDFLHTARIAEMARALSDGHFPVRWSENFGYGYGMPLFEFYAPLPFYVGGLLALLGVPLLFVTKLLFVMCNIGTIWGSYLLGRSFYGRVGGLLAAAAISLAPYRAVNLYVRGALSESWGIMAAIWIMYFTFQVMSGKRRAWMGLTASLVGLFLSHNLLTLIFIPFAIAFTMVLIVFIRNVKKEHKIVSLLKVVQAYLLAIGISAFYLFPAFIEKSLTKVEESIVGGYFDYSLHFVYLRQLITPNWGYGGSNWGPVDGISFFLGYGQLLALALSGILLAKYAFMQLKGKPVRMAKSRWLIVSCLVGLLIFSVLLTTEKTAFIWNSVELLQFVQFPWRFLSVVLILLGVIAPFFLFSHTSFIKRWLIGWVMLLIFMANALYFRPENKLDDPSILYTGSEEVIKSELSQVLPDYLPRDSTNRTSPPSSLLHCNEECSVISVNTNKVHQKVVRLVTDVPTTVTFSVHYFPGWLAKLNDQVVPTLIENGLISVALPAGESLVTIEFGNTQLRSITDMVSLASLTLFLSIAAYYCFRKKIW